MISPNSFHESSDSTCHSTSLVKSTQNTNYEFWIQVRRPLSHHPNVSWKNLCQDDPSIFRINCESIVLLDNKNRKNTQNKMENNPMTNISWDTMKFFDSIESSSTSSSSSPPPPFTWSSLGNQPFLAIPVPSLYLPMQQEENSEDSISYHDEFLYETLYKLLQEKEDHIHNRHKDEFSSSLSSSVTWHWTLRGILHLDSHHGIRQNHSSLHSHSHLYSKSHPTLDILLWTPTILPSSSSSTPLPISSSSSSSHQAMIRDKINNMILALYDDSRTRIHECNYTTLNFIHDKYPTTATTITQEEKHKGRMLPLLFLPLPLISSIQITLSSVSFSPSSTQEETEPQQQQQHQQQQQQQQQENTKAHSLPLCPICFFRIEPKYFGCHQAHSNKCSYQCISYLQSLLSNPSSQSSHVHTWNNSTLHSNFHWEHVPSFLPYTHSFSSPLETLVGRNNLDLHSRILYCNTCQVLYDRWIHTPQYPTVYQVRQSYDFDAPSIPTLACSHCGMKETLWVCLTCATIGCGRYSHGHAEQHFHHVHHPYALELVSQRIWDYSSSCFIQRNDILHCPMMQPILFFASSGGGGGVSGTGSFGGGGGGMVRDPLVSWTRTNNSIGHDRGDTWVDTHGNTNLFSSTFSSSDLATTSTAATGNNTLSSGSLNQQTMHREENVNHSTILFSTSTCHSKDTNQNNDNTTFMKKSQSIGEEYEALLQSALEDQAHHYEDQITKLRALFATQNFHQDSSRPITPAELDEVEHLKEQIRDLRTNVEILSKQVLDAQGQEAGHRATSNVLMRQQNIAKGILDQLNADILKEHNAAKVQIEDLEQQIVDLTNNLRMRRQFTQNQELMQSQILLGEGNANTLSTPTRRSNKKNTNESRRRAMNQKK